MSTPARQLRDALDGLQREIDKLSGALFWLWYLTAATLLVALMIALTIRLS